MKLEVISPPGDEKLLAEIGAALVNEAKDLGLNMDYEGFLMAWIGTGVRVIVARESDGSVKGILLLAIGQRWLHNDFSSSVLAINGVYKEEMLEFAVNMAKAIGATKMYVELEESTNVKSNGDIERIMLEKRLQ